MTVRGQSNALQLVRDSRPSTASVYQLGIAGAALNVGGGGVDWPFGWGPDDPNGWRAKCAAQVVASGTVHPPMNLWIQGEADAGQDSDHYEADVNEMIDDDDARTGRADSVWIIVKLNDAFAALAPVGTPLVRAAVDAVAAARPTRVVVINVDDLVPPDGVHYDTAQYLEIWDRALAAMATITSDAAWEA